MTFRHEAKHEIGIREQHILTERLSLLMQEDAHGENGTYLVRSLYFDDLYDTALTEKLNGISRRKKFRLRFYNDDPSFVRLEKKTKRGQLSYKESVVISREEALCLMKGSVLPSREETPPLLTELRAKTVAGLLRPKTIVSYCRKAFYYPYGNVRITLDSDIRTGMYDCDFLHSENVLVPVPESPLLLEVKWDAFLPEVIRAALQLRDIRETAYSKYAACRAFG